MTPPEIIRRAREAAGMSQIGLDRAAALPRGKVGTYEAGRHVPDLSTAARLCRALGVSLAVFDDADFASADRTTTSEQS